MKLELINCGIVFKTKGVLESVILRGAYLDNKDKSFLAYQSGQNTLKYKVAGMRKVYITGVKTGGLMSFVTFIKGENTTEEFSSLEDVEAYRNSVELVQRISDTLAVEDTREVNVPADAEYMLVWGGNVEGNLAKIKVQTSPFDL